MAAYEEQRNWVRHWLVRIEDHNTTQIEHLDFLWAFFQNRWHMKDWIKKDGALAQTLRDSIESEVKEYGSLMVCADLANRSKHLQLRAYTWRYQLAGRHCAGASPVTAGNF